MSNDVSRFEILLLLASISSMTPLTFIVGTYIVYRRVGVAVFAFVLSFLAVTAGGFLAGVKVKFTW